MFNKRFSTYMFMGHVHRRYRVLFLQIIPLSALGLTDSYNFMRCHSASFSFMGPWIIWLLIMLNNVEFNQVFNVLSFVTVCLVNHFVTHKWVFKYSKPISRFVNWTVCISNKWNQLLDIPKSKIFLFTKLSPCPRLEIRLD